MPHKIAISIFNDVTIAVKADQLLEYFPIESPYRVPNVPEEICWMQNLRGKIITHIMWWKMLDADCKHTFNRFDFNWQQLPYAILFQKKDCLISLPIQEVCFIESLSNEEFQSIFESEHSPLSWKGHIFIDPESLTFSKNQEIEQRTA